MFLLFVMSIALTAQPSVTGICPRQPEPAALASAAFSIPVSGETLLFSSAPSFQRVRYALRITKPAEAGVASASLVRLSRRSDCNVHERVGEWHFKLSTQETQAIFAAASALETLDGNASDIVLDGTTVELQRYASGQAAFTYSSNGIAKDHLSSLVLEVLKRHVPVGDLPRAADWRYRLPGTSL